MPQAADLARALQRELAPVLHDAATSLATEIDRHASAAEIAALPNLGPLLQAMAGRTVDGGGKALDFGAGNQFGNVSIGDIALGSITKLTLNFHTHQAAPLLSSVDPLGESAPLPNDSLAGGNNNGTTFVAPEGGEAKPRPGRVLVLDGETGSQIAAALRLALRLRGLESPDPAPLAVHTAQSLRDDLDAADAAVLVLSPLSCATTTLRERELPAVWSRYGQSAPFWLIPLIDGVAPATADATLNMVGATLKNFRAIELPADPTSHAGALAALAGLLLHSVAAPLLSLSVAAGRSLALTLFSYPASGATPAADLALGWDALFPQPERPTRRPPGLELWHEQLDPALADLRLVAGASHASTLSISGRYHLSAGLALGFRFRTVAGMVLHIAAQPGGVWQSDGPGNEGTLLSKEEIPGVPGAHDLSIEVSLARDVRADADAYLEAAGVAVGRRIQLTSTPLLSGDIDAVRTFVASPAHARHLANQIANVILSHSKGTIHLFAAIPQGLAVLIGARLNRARPVQCYELFDDPSGVRVYVPASRLS